MKEEKHFCGTTCANPEVNGNTADAAWKQVMMKYNEKYDRYVTKSGLVYRYNKRQCKFVLCKLIECIGGYLKVNVSKPKIAKVLVHRLVYETFVCNIPDGYEIDHINTIKGDNSLTNLRAVTHNDNMNNPLTRKQISESMTGKPKSEFGNKFKAHYGITKHEDTKLYQREYLWYYTHNNKCRWEN